MKREDFKTRLKEIGITQKSFAIATGYGYSTVKGWKTIPRWVNVVLDCLEVMIEVESIDDSLRALTKLNNKSSGFYFNALSNKERK